MMLLSDMYRFETCHFLFAPFAYLDLGSGRGRASRLGLLIERARVRRLRLVGSLLLRDCLSQTEATLIAVRLKCNQ